MAARVIADAVTSQIPILRPGPWSQCLPAKKATMADPYTICRVMMAIFSADDRAPSPDQVGPNAGIWYAKEYMDGGEGENSNRAVL
jgi:hypothetical protein